MKKFEKAYIGSISFKFTKEQIQTIVRDEAIRVLRQQKNIESENTKAIVNLQRRVSKLEMTLERLKNEKR